MIQLRWTDEDVWKDAHWLRSIEQGEEEWRQTCARYRPGNRPPGVEFRVRPYFTMDAQVRIA